MPHATRAARVSEKDLQKDLERDSEMTLAVVGADGEKWQDFKSFCLKIKRQLHEIHGSDIEGGGQLGVAAPPWAKHRRLALSLSALPRFRCHARPR